jgi:HK97 gp10 family phage protein
VSDTTQVYGLLELGANIDKLFKETAQKVVKKAGAAGGEVLRRGMRQRAPVRQEGGPKGKDQRLPGYGKRHIRRWTRKNPDGSLSNYVGPDKKAFYLGYAEKGTSHQKAEPFIRPTFDIDGPKAEQAFVDTARIEMAKELP